MAHTKKEKELKKKDVQAKGVHMAHKRKAKELNLRDVPVKKKTLYDRLEAKRHARKTFSQSEVQKRKARRENVTFAAFASNEELYEKYKTSYFGLEEDQVEENEDEYGRNRVIKGKPKSILKRIQESFFNPFSLILIALIIVSSITDIILPKIKGTFEPINYITVFIILALVIISGAIRFVQEIRSDSSAAKLLKMITTTTCVERVDLGKEEIPLTEVVVGDIVHLSNGDMIPADVRIIECKDFFVNESSLTGESDHIEKFSQKETKHKESATGYKNIAFMGTNVISGSARAVVIAVGEDTQFGAIAKTIQTAPQTPTSFEKGVTSVSKILIRFMVIMLPIVFIINGLTKKSDDRWIQALLFAISIAVGLTPEMLPMIVTASLAKGTIAMAKKKTIIKNINSIQSLGAMDILCTDKTGTITQNKVVLEYSLNVDGEEDLRVLRHAYLNSYFQTGFKNLMDIAIIKRREKLETQDARLVDLSEEYKKIDEVPFDFERKRLSVVVVDRKGKTQMVTKGAVEEMVSISSYVEVKGQVVPLTEDIKKKVFELTDKLNNNGMRVIGVSQKTNPAPVGEFGKKDETEMVLMGFLVFLDPPKATTEAAIAALKSYGVRTKVLTGDNEKVTASICSKVGMDASGFMLGSQIDDLDDDELLEVVEKYDIFAKLTPEQKARIVKALQENGHVVGFLGDGINDTPAMKVADVGISVDDAVDIAKETADIILLEKDLMVLEQGIIEGRKTYGNMIKYIKMTASSNFGNMFSVLIASALLPFLPMKSLYLILLNMIYDISCTAIPWDHVDTQFLQKPRRWKADNIPKFMVWFGPTSSIFDWITYAVMFFILCPMAAGGKWGAPGTDTALFIAAFQTGWFIQSMWTQTLVVHMLRTDKVSFFKSNASLPVYITTILAIVLVTVMPWTIFGEAIGLVKLAWPFFVYLAVSTVVYLLVKSVAKELYIKRYGEML